MAQANPGRQTSANALTPAQEEKLRKKILLKEQRERDKEQRDRDAKHIPRHTKSKKVMNMLRSKTKLQWIINGLILVLLSVLLVVFELDMIPFRVLGYRCKDPNLTHKYRGDTVSFVHLMVSSTCVPFVSIMIVELFVINRQDNFGSVKKKKITTSLLVFGKYALGFLALLLFVQLCKCLIAEPRPHFFQTCKPDKINCTEGYVTDYKCMNDYFPRAVRDSYRSFPSGHAALGVYVSTFLIWYFQKRIPPSGYLVVPWFHGIFFSWGLLCALTRVTDRRHHWWDILAGSLFGFTFAAYTAVVICHNFYTPPPPPEVIAESGGNNGDKKGEVPEVSDTEGKPAKGK